MVRDEYGEPGTDGYAVIATAKMPSLAK